MADVFVRLLFIIFEWLWQLGNSPVAGIKANVASIFKKKKLKKEDIQAGQLLGKLRNNSSPFQAWEGQKDDWNQPGENYQG